MNVEPMYPKWLQSFAAFPAIVRVACSTEEGVAVMPHSFYCVSNGDVVLSPTGQLGRPSIESAINTCRELVWTAYRWDLSELPVRELQSALEYPDAKGELVFCFSRTQPAILTQDEHDDLVDEVIETLCAEANREPSGMLLLDGLDRPAVIVSELEASKGLRPEQISASFIEECRVALRASVSATLDCLVQDASARCEFEEASVG